MVGAEFSADDVVITSISTDTRTLTAGALFVALRGENFDGHDFIDEAFSKGAVAALTTRPVKHPSLQVSDTVNAIGQIAKHHRQQLTARVIAITGSSGKTSTKDLMACALMEFGTVVKSEKSLNNEIGVPLTILQANDDTDFLVLEMGMRGLGQIDYLVKLANPDVSVLLNAGSAHLSELGSRENILKAKSEIFNKMKVNGFAVTSADDERLVHVSKKLDVEVVLFGQSDRADIQILDLQVNQAGYPSATLKVQTSKHDISLNRVGEHQIHNAAAVIAVTTCLQLDIARVISALETCSEQSPWRMEIIQCDNHITLINDSYNANPESVRAGLKALKDFAGGRRTWAVLGEMRELGDAAVEEHDAIGRLCVRLDISKTLAVGENARGIQLGASHEGSWGQESLFVSSVDDAIAVLLEEVTTGDVVFIKASRAVGLERVAKALEEHFQGKNKPS